MNQTIAIVGTGRVAHALATSLAALDIPITAVAGRTRAHVGALAARLGSARPLTIPQVPAVCTHVIIAIADDALEDVIPQLAGCQVVLHTSGASGYLSTPGIKASGVLHPLQTFPDTPPPLLTGAAFAYGGDPLAEEWARTLIDRFGGTPLHIAPDRWAHYHAAAVMASNYQATLLDAAIELMKSAGIPEPQALHALEPLTRASIDNIFRVGPTAALTGPIRRGDTKTLRRHLAALTQLSTETHDLYLAAASRTLPIAARQGIQTDQIRISLRAHSA